MSKWTLIRKAEAARFDRLQNLWEGCFKMKLDDRKTEGVTRFGFRKRTIKSTKRPHLKTNDSHTILATVRMYTQGSLKRNHRF